MAKKKAVKKKVSKSRIHDNGICECWNEINKYLKENDHNTEIDLDLTYTGHHYLPLKTRKIDSKKRGKPKIIFASHCPVCGEKLAEDNSKGFF